MDISVIIPAYNESESITELLYYLQKHADESVTKILVVDGQSTDDTFKKVTLAGFTCLSSPKKGRASQMNFGAEKATGDILYFVHADSFPPESYASDIKKVTKNGAESGCYRFRFDSDSLLLKINSWFTRFDRLMCRGGDQTLFIKREVFEEFNGFKNYAIMEDFEMIRRLRDRDTFKIIPKNAVVSARKYEENSYLKVNLINLVIFTMFRIGASEETMVHAYQQLIEGTKFGNQG
jgi:rSAM/selenodomain-associated transferase 2